MVDGRDKCGEERTMKRGTIKRIIHRRGGGGFAFISREGKPDVYIDLAELGGAVFRSLGVGDALSFSVVESPKAPRATNAKIIMRARAAIGSMREGLQ